MKKIKIAIIGAGTAGLTARREVDKVTNDYLVFDGGKLGTTCARVGCMPSKSLIQISNDYASTKFFKKNGIFGSENLEVDIPMVFDRVRMLRDRFTNGVISDMDKWNDKFINKFVKFVDSNTLEADGEELLSNFVSQPLSSALN